LKKRKDNRAQRQMEILELKNIRKKNRVKKEDRDVSKFEEDEICMVEFGVSAQVRDKCIEVERDLEIRSIQFEILCITKEKEYIDKLTEVKVQFVARQPYDFLLLNDIKESYKPWKIPDHDKFVLKKNMLCAGRAATELITHHGLPTPLTVMNSTFIVRLRGEVTNVLHNRFISFPLITLITEYAHDGKWCLSVEERQGFQKNRLKVIPPMITPLPSQYIPGNSDYVVSQTCCFFHRL